jgi:hypothetical protein
MRRTKQQKVPYLSEDVLEDILYKVAHEIWSYLDGHDHP